MDALCQFWLKLVKWFWRRKFSSFVDLFSLFCYNLPFEKGGILHLNKLKFLGPRMMCNKFVWNWPSGSVEEGEKVKNNNNVDYDNNGKRTIYDRKSSLDPSAQVS